MPQIFRKVKDKVRSKISRKGPPQASSGGLSMPDEQRKASSENKSKYISVAETGWNGLKLALKILKEASSAFPPLQSAVGGLLEILKAIDVSSCALVVAELLMVTDI